MLRLHPMFAPLFAAVIVAAAAVTAQDPAWSTPELTDQIAVRDGRTGARLSFAELLDELARADAVFLGETHLDETTHRVELAVYEGMLARREDKVVLSLEMFERDVQPAVDDYTNGRIDEATFLQKARPWGNYGTAYRRLIERARRAALPVVAANFPRMLRRGLGSADDPFARLDGHLRSLAPEQLLANGKGYWRRVDNAVRGHIGMMGGPSDPDDPRLLDMQSLWDNSMGEACALALDRHPGHMVLHVNGGFHTAYWDGTARQFALRKPDAKLRTVDIVPIANPGAGLPRGLPRADFVVYAEARANDIDEGAYTVVTARELRYRLHVPEKASHQAPVPLLIWLGDDGLTAQDGMDLWRERIGDDVAIAVLEAPYRERGLDLGESGRWFWADTFRQDIGVMIEAVERTWGYALRNLPVDPGRVVLAGEGTGATVTAATTVLSDRIGCTGLAIEPRRYAKIKDFPLPLPELDGDDERPARRLRVIGTASDRDWWQGELDEYTAVGLENAFSLRTDDPWQRAAELEESVLQALGQPVATAAATTSRRHVVVASNTPRAWHWARLFARQSSSPGAPVAVLRQSDGATGSTPIDVQVRAADYASSGSKTLPLCPGPFGGTTVLVLLAGTPQDEVDAWLDLEKNDPLTARSRFHRMRVAVAGATDGRALPQVLADLRSKNRNNVLILPAAFCADGAVMRALADSTEEAADTMTLHWLPGLGGQ